MRAILRACVVAGGVFLLPGVATAHVDREPPPRVKDKKALKLVNSWQKTDIKRTDRGFKWAKIRGRYRTLWHNAHPPRPHSHVPATLERIAQCESGGSYTAKNPTSTASGKYQFLDSTWQAVGGTGRAMDAPPWEQDMRAIRLFAGGAGAHHWYPSRHCWGG